MTKTAESAREQYLKFCPHCGAGGFKSHGKGEYACCGCGFHYYTNSASAVAAIVRDGDGRLLIARRGRAPEKGKLDLPGGFVEPGESAEEALRREIREELSKEIATMRYIESSANEYEYSGHTVATTDLLFECELEDTRGIEAGDDVATLEWKTPTEIDLEEVAFASIRKFIEHYQKCAQTKADAPEERKEPSRAH